MSAHTFVFICSVDATEFYRVLTQRPVAQLVKGHPLAVGEALGEVADLGTGERRTANYRPVAQLVRAHP